MPNDWNTNRRVVIRNLGITTTEEILNHFEECGRIVQIWIARRPPGIAFVEYAHRKDAKSAVRMFNNTDFCNWMIKVELSVTRRRRRNRSRSHSRRRHTRARSRSPRVTSTSRQQSSSRPSNSDSRVQPMPQLLQCYSCYSNALDKQPVVAKCGHVFCFNCISHILESESRQCPKCRAKVRESQLTPINRG